MNRILARGCPIWTSFKPEQGWRYAGGCWSPPPPPAPSWWAAHLFGVAGVAMFLVIIVVAWRLRVRAENEAGR